MTTYQSTSKLEISETVCRAVSYGVCDIKLTNVSGDGFCYLIDMELDIFTEQETRYLTEFLTVEETAFNYNAPINPQFLGAQPARAGEDY